MKLDVPLCPHDNHRGVCPLCEGVWEGDRRLEPQPAYCGECGDGLEDGACPNLVCRGKRTTTAKAKTAAKVHRGPRVESPPPEEWDSESPPMSCDPAPNRVRPSPFSFGHAMLEPICQPLYDTITIRESAPNGFYNAFTDHRGKSDVDIHPSVGGGGQLYASTMFVCDGLRVTLCSARHYDREALEADRVALVNGTSVNLRIGIRDYCTLPLALLPHRFPRRRLTIPPQMSFRVQLDVAGVPRLCGDWRALVVLDGELGREVH